MDDKINLTKELLGDRADDGFIMWLMDIGYFKAPAAINHHGNHEGGLFEHSLEVCKQLKHFTECLNLKWDCEESPGVVGLLHDICKTDDYSTNGYINYEANYVYNDHKIMDGHGDKSVIMLAGHFPLTEEEVMCIRFHMGAFTDKDQWGYYSKAVKKYPNILFTHTADMIASQILEV